MYNIWVLHARAPVSDSLWFAASAFISAGDKRTARRSCSLADYANAPNLWVIPEVNRGAS